MSDNNEIKQEEIWIGDFLIKPSSDKTILYLEVDPSDSEFIDNFKKNWEKIKTDLKTKNFFGILDEPELIDNKIIIAKATPPKPPIPEKIELFKKFVCVLKDEKLSTPEKEETKREDLREAYQTIICAEKDESIGKWYPPVPGVAGVNIFGEPIEPPEIDEAPFTLGNNLYIDENNFIRAKEAGVILIENNKIEIYPEYTIKGDVDFSVGNVNFIGKKLIIKGDIKFGFKVKAKGDVELEGGTENKVLIDVEGNFKCNGIIRGENTKLKVKGTAELKGVEYAKLEIEGNLVIDSYLIFSDTYVMGDILATSGKGIIYGGSIKCSGNIEAKILGNESQTPTQILAGYKANIIESYLKCIQKEILFKESLKKLKVGLELGEKLKKEGRLTKEKEGILEKIKDQFQKHLDELDKIRVAITDLKKQITVFKNKIIKVLEVVYPGVIVGITDKTYTVSEEKRGPLVFYLE
uniref:FapA family protein n=1 Tax=Thermodesulfobacterium hydrogeniphilum TaxID=161156 RepID=UPI000570B261